MIKRRPAMIDEKLHNCINEIKIARMKNGELVSTRRLSKAIGNLISSDINLKSILINSPLEPDTMKRGKKLKFR